MNALSRLAKFARKEYRDGYLQSHVRSSIAYQIQALRQKFGLSQAAFAERTGKRQSMISRLEDTGYGKVTVQTLLDIATSLDVALLVRFVSYPEFLQRNADMSAASLQPNTIHETLQSNEGSGATYGTSLYAFAQVRNQAGQTFDASYAALLRPRRQEAITGELTRRQTSRQAASEGPWTAYGVN